jgi:AcrR family transcriptional regulator
MADAAQNTRARLLASARELFTSQGYHGTTTPMIAERSGVAEGTIYRHFPGKQALLNSVYQETQQWGLDRLREAGDGGGSTGDVLGRLGRALLAAAEEEPARIRFLLGWNDQGLLDEASQQAAQGFQHALETLIARGKQEGSVRAGLVELWTMIWLTLVRAAALRVAAREWNARHPHAIATLDAAWEAIAWRPIQAGAPGSNSTERTTEEG